jgi:hypothetical protein
MSAASRRALAAYRDLLRAARALPTANRRDYVRAKARREFELARGETDLAKLEALFVFSELSTENVAAQARHLQERALFAPWAA